MRPRPCPGPGAAGARRPGSLALALVLPLLGVAIGLAIGWRHPATLPWLLQQVPGLQATGVEARLANQEWRIAELHWQLPAQGGVLHARQLVLRGWSIQARPDAQRWAAVHIDQLQVASLQFQRGPGDGQPAKPPKSLRMPLSLSVTQLQVNTLQVDDWPAFAQVQAGLALGDRAGARHVLRQLSGHTVLEAGTARATQLQLQGEATLGADAPLPLSAQVAVQRVALGPASAASAAPAAAVAGAASAARAAPAGAAASAALAPASSAAKATTADGGRRPPTPFDRPWQARLQLDGPLVDSLQARLQWDAVGPATGGPQPSLQAQARLSPWAAWPLGQLNLSTRGLDLQALWPDWPQTLIDGDAQIHTQGAQQPIDASITLDNRRPGPWDAGAVPLRQLRLATRTTAQHPDQGRLERFSLQLADAQGDAGRVTGQGQWRADTLDLTLAFDGLQPARLHRAAAALRLQGQMVLAAKGLGSAGGPSVHWDGRLDGQSLEGPGLPVQLATAGDLGPDRLHLQKAEAQAGEALASAQLDLRWQPTGWQAEASAQWQRFDPRPWWRGAPGSPWRTGPHRLDGQLRTTLRSTQPLATWAQRPRAAMLAALSGQAQLQLLPSLLAGVPLSGEAAVQGSGPDWALQLQADLGGNRLQVAGRLPGTTGALAAEASRLPGFDAGALAGLGAVPAAPAGTRPQHRCPKGRPDTGMSIGRRPIWPSSPLGNPWRPRCWPAWRPGGRRPAAHRARANGNRPPMATGPPRARARCRPWCCPKASSNRPAWIGKSPASPARRCCSSSTPRTWRWPACSGWTA